MKHLYIFGTGGFGREALICFIDICKAKSIDYTQFVSFVIDDEYHKDAYLMGVPVIKKSQFNHEDGEVFIGLADPYIRKEIVMKLPSATKFATLLHPTALISDWVSIGEGTIVCAGSILTTQITIGKHAHFNLNTTVGHDCVIGDYFTSSPGVNISGNCVIGDNVFLGTNTAVREKTTICDNVIVGMSSSVLKSLDESGVYVGNPAKKVNL